ncbi:MAG: hypothetical protein ACYTHK_14490 [Planctomycetota bacterium]|jgi:hypothetical protein
MSELIAILAVAGLAVTFVLTHRNRGCPGPEGCADSEAPGHCPGCPLATTLESGAHKSF